MRERWFGATGRRVPELALEGSLDLKGALVLDDVSDPTRLREAHAQGTPVVVRAATPEAVKAALARPEVASVLVPTEELLALDLTTLTYGCERLCRNTNSTRPANRISITFHRRLRACVSETQASARRHILDRACDLERGQWGVATQSKFLAVGSIVPWAEPGAGAIATQAYANPATGRTGSRCCARVSRRTRW